MKNATAPYLEKIKHAGISIGVIAACLFLAILVIVFAYASKVHQRNTQLADTQKQLTQAKSETTRTQTELDKAKIVSSELQAQLDKTKSQQLELDTSKEALVQLQSQLDKSKGVLAQLLAQLEEGNAHSAELRTQLDSAVSGSTQLLGQLNEAKIQSMDLQARLQKAESDIAELQPLLLKTGHMPVTTSFDKNKDGRSFTLHVNNLYRQPVSMDINISGVNKSRSQHEIIGSGGTQKIEKLVAGENVIITSAGYDPLNLYVQ